MDNTRNRHLAFLTRFLPITILFILGIASVSCSKLGSQNDAAVIHGLVLDVYEKPLDKITVHIAHLADKTFSAVTTSDGSFDVNLGDHSGYAQLLYSLSVEAEGYLEYNYEFYVDGNRDYFILIRLLSTEEEIVEDDEDDYEALPSFRFGGYNYRFYSYMHYVFWDQAMNSSKTLVLFEYRDWTLPSILELYAITEAGFRNPVCWSRDEYKPGYPYIMTLGSSEIRYTKASDNLYDAYFVRREPDSRPSYESLPTFQYNGHTYRVFEDIGTVPYQEAIQMCDNLNVDGRTGWKIPSIQELGAMNEHKDVIGGFNLNVYYWSTTEGKDYEPAHDILVYDFKNGKEVMASTSMFSYSLDFQYAHHLRPIRMEN